MDFQEFTGDNVDLAINEACTRLQVPSFELEYEVISKESAGFLGFGKKPARIRARKKEVQETVKAESKSQKEEKAKEVKPVKKVEAAEPVAEEKKEESVKPEMKKEPRNKNKKKNFEKKQKSVSGEEKKENKENRREPRKEQPKREPKPEPVVVERSEEEIAAIKKAADDFLKEVFTAMELAVEINTQYNKETGNLEIDFAGDDMGILIGKRGQTLDSLQYLTSLVVNKNENAYVRVKLDTENYRSRRKDTLENLAKNIAFKVKKTRKPVSLEPMNPYERRIIHSALQGNKFVETYSEGNEPYRHVVVTLKKNAYYQRDEK